MNTYTRKSLLELENKLKDIYLDCNYENFFDYDDFNAALILIWDDFHSRISSLNFRGLVSQLFPQGFDGVVLPLSVSEGRVA